MKLKAVAGFVTALLISGPLAAKNKPPACVVYFAVMENDEATVHLSMVGLNKSVRGLHHSNERFDNAVVRKEQVSEGIFFYLHNYVSWHETVCAPKQTFSLTNANSTT